MIIFLDTNILVDFAVEERERHLEARELIRKCVELEVDMVTSVLCIGTFVYLVKKSLSLDEAGVNNWLMKLNQLIRLIPTSNNMVNAAATSKFNDAEDGILYFTAVYNDCQGFVTQNIKDFPEPRIIPVYTTSQMLDELK